MLDADDRKELARIALMAAGGAVAVLGGSALLGLSVAIFRLLGGF